MAEGITGPCLRDREDGTVRRSDVVDDELRRSGVSVPLERYGQTIRYACVKLNKHYVLHW